MFAFALLVASLLTLHEPDEMFEPEQFGEFVAPALAALAAEGVPGRDVADLTETLRGALHVDPEKRPSLTQLRDVLERLQANLVARPEAAFVLTTKARKGLAQAGFAAEAEAWVLTEAPRQTLSTRAPPPGAVVDTWTPGVRCHPHGRLHPAGSGPG